MNSFVRRRSTELLVLAAYILLAALAWQSIFFAQHPIPYDMAEQGLPWRYFVGEALQQHQLPIWDPYMQWGHPLSLAPSGTAWYPPVWLLGYFFGYDFTIISIEFVAHLTLSAMGMFFLLRNKDCSNYAAWFAGAAWMCSGFFVGCAQHMSWVVSAAWLPWTLLFLNRALENYSKRDAISAGLTVFMHLSGGYVAVVILLFYYTLAFSFMQMVSTKKIRAQIRYMFLIGFVAACSSLVILAGYFLTHKLALRGGPITLEEAFSNPFPLKAFLTFVLPSAGVGHADLFATDISMSNAYLGIFFLLFFFSSVTLWWRQRDLWWYLLVALFCAVAALGEESFLRGWLYDYIPGMNLFRHPSLFRMFMMALLLVPAARGLDALLGAIRWLPVILSVAGVVFMMTVATFIYRAEGLTLREDFGLQLLVQVIMLALFVLLWKQKDRIAYSKIAIGTLLLLSVDLIVAVRLNAPWTAIDKSANCREQNSKLATLPMGLVISSDTLVESTYNKLDMHGWRNTNHYYKRISYDGYNPFETRGQLALTESCIFDQVKERPLVYFSDTVLLYADRNKCVLPARGIFVNSVAALWHLEEQDLSTRGAEVKKIEPRSDGFTIVYDAVKPSILTLQQSWWPYWEAVDEKGNLIRLECSNFNTISMPVEAGLHVINLSFRPKVLIWAMWGSLISIAWFLALILLANMLDWVSHIYHALTDKEETEESTA